MSRIKLDRISMRFGDFYAVRDISLEIGNGEYVTILGPSGCGKTTLIKVISGIWTPTEGKVYVDGKDVTNVPMEDRDVGYVFSGTTSNTARGSRTRARTGRTSCRRSI